mmetsp:Transcript_24525/g.68198  ORF Transcript_24525/g.68198 Transcript_24525/m.68198 type:complete len:299 (-) Transcript_24525:738-1634(-)
MAKPLLCTAVEPLAGTLSAPRALPSRQLETSAGAPATGVGPKRLTEGVGVEEPPNPEQEPDSDMSPSPKLPVSPTVAVDIAAMEPSSGVSAVGTSRAGVAMSFGDGNHTCEAGRPGGGGGRAPPAVATDNEASTPKPTPRPGGGGVLGDDGASMAASPWHETEGGGGVKGSSLATEGLGNASLGACVAGGGVGGGGGCTGSRRPCGAAASAGVRDGAAATTHGCGDGWTHGTATVGASVELPCSSPSGFRTMRTVPFKWLKATTPPGTFHICQKASTPITACSCASLSIAAKCLGPSK